MGRLSRFYNNAVSVKDVREGRRDAFNGKGASVDEPLGTEVVERRPKPAERVAFRNSMANNLLAYLENPSDNGQVNIESYIRMYRQGKARHSFQVLTAEQYSSMIRFLGTLSVYSSRRDTLSSGASYGPENIFGFDGRALFVDEKLFGKHYWAFVLELARDKGHLGHHLTKEDNYWLMVAALEDAKRDLTGLSSLIYCH